ncbi:molybdate transport system substrate-binding protein [Sinorhizobium terangae]|nr:molybdate transport system substrate-binding protein [Sinorhizobium terangae]
MAAKAGSPPLDIASVEAFEHALKSARSIAYAADGTSGGYFSGLLERLGIADEVKPKLVGRTGGQTALAVARGEAELGVVPVTSILAAAPDVMLVGRFPAELQSYIDFAIGISADPRDAEAAKRLSEFLMADEVDDTLRQRVSSAANRMLDKLGSRPPADGRRGGNSCWCPSVRSGSKRAVLHEPCAPLLG